MKKILLILALITLFAGTANAQMKQITVVDPDGNSSFYPGIGEALVAAPANSSIIIPGGEYYWGYELTRPVHIYGVGHYPGSSADGPEGKTQLVGYAVVFGSGSDGSSITGVDAVRGMGIHGEVHNLNIFRCKAESFGFYVYGSEETTQTGIKIRECIFQYDINAGRRGKYCIIEKNIVRSIIGFDYSIIANNISNSANQHYGIDGISNSLIINNILTGVYYMPIGNNSNCNIINNLLVVNNQEWSAGSNTYSGNAWGVPLDEIFVDVPSEEFSYDNNYHVLSSWTTYSAAYGENEAGLEVGIYGTKYPYKEEVDKTALPVIPNITNANISTQLNSEGKVEVEVSAQAQTK